MSLLAAAITPEWLSLREPADHAARSRDLVGRLTAILGVSELVIHDLGSGTGSMTRWLAPQLPQAQHWVLHDMDESLLEHAVVTLPPRVFADAASTVSTRHQDVTRISPADLTDAALVTTSALLDLLTADEVTRLVTACAGSGTPALFTLSVTGQVAVTPPHALDATISVAFNAHQRRAVAGRRLLGPDAPKHAAAAFSRLGVDVIIKDSPWQLGADHSELLVEWLTGWVAAAAEQHPDLIGPARDYLRRRLADAAAGRLEVSVGHADLLALPARPEP